MQLAYAFCNDKFFEDKTIAIIEPTKKNTNDKRWSFWEKGIGNWDNLVSSKWHNGKLSSRFGELNLNLGNYIYKSVQALDFYNFTIDFLTTNANVVFIENQVLKISTSSKTVTTEKAEYTADFIFDSRIPKQFNQAIQTGTANLVHQHFKGWVIKTELAVFNQDEFIMMDFTAKFENTCSFMYVLPYSETEALVEMTFFTPEIKFEGEYNKLLKQYIENKLRINYYEILEVEQGNIPMTDFPFHEYNSEDVLKIGTAGGWVKGSTGYSFKRCKRFIDKIIINLKEGKRLDSGLYKRRFLWYDKIFLRVLKNYNHLGDKIFFKLYSKNPHTLIFKFLDEETTIGEELKIMGSLFSTEFITSVFKK